jgi:hypothetical protein
MTTRNEIIQIATDVVAGRRAGNVEHAKAALTTLLWIETRDLILGETTTDQQANDEIVTAVAELGKGERK